jgi:hypothetical protein
MMATTNAKTVRDQRPRKKTRALKNPKGGLTAAGRAAFRRKEGSRLKPGVKKKVADMSPDEMRRKGSWAVRFYGRSGKLPALKTKDGQPTRFALTARRGASQSPRQPRQRATSRRKGDVCSTAIGECGAQNEGQRLRGGKRGNEGSLHASSTPTDGGLRW